MLLYEPIKDYLKATTLDLNSNTLKQFSESCLCRVFYELEIKNYKYNTPIQNDQQKSFDKLKDMYIYPEFIKEKIFKLPNELVFITEKR